MPAAVQTLRLSHLAHAPAHVALFAGVENAAGLRARLLRADAAFEYALLDASALLSAAHVEAAVFRAVNDLLNGRLKTRNVHSEIVFSLSPNNNIADSFRRFGVQDTTTALLAIKVSTPAAPVSAESVQAHLSASVHGTPVPFTDASLAAFSDLARIRKIYKLDSATPSQRGKNAGKKGRRVDGDAAQSNGAAGEGGVYEDERKEMEVCILGIMALKGS